MEEGREAGALGRSTSEGGDTGGQDGLQDEALFGEVGERLLQTFWHLHSPHGLS